MTPIPSFIQIGETYFATIKSGTGEDVLKDEFGKKIPFETSTRAVEFARKRILPAKVAILPPNAVDPEIAAWKAGRVEAQHAGRHMLDMIGIEVVTKRRKRPLCRAV